MKSINLTDFLFILFAGLILILLTEIGYGSIFTRYPLPVIIGAYFIGKYLNLRQTRS